MLSDGLSRLLPNQRCRHPISMSLAHPSLSVLTAAVIWIALTGPTRATPRAAWVQLIGPDGSSSVRAIINKGNCPDLMVDGKPVRMNVRADPKALFPGHRKKMPTADFRVQVCETIVPAGTASAVLEDRPLSLPPPEIRRIVVLGDTGCRVKKKKTQDCNDPKKSPHAKLVEHAAQARPDLVIHLGDYLYREKRCSKRVTDCPNVATGYGWNVWDADFFTPSSPLLAAAPWIMVRGNHETCGRAGEGWYRFLDAAQPGGKCPEMSDFYVVSYGNMGFAGV